MVEKKGEKGEENLNPNRQERPGIDMPMSRAIAKRPLLEFKEGWDSILGGLVQKEAG